MPFALSGELRTHYELVGPAGAPAIVFSNSLGADLSAWDRQAQALEGRFRVLRYDTRGHGRSSVTRGPYTIAQLGGDVVSLLEALGLRQVHFCGLSLGGMVGMWLGVHAAERVSKLVLCNTAPRIGEAERWNARIESVRTGGMGGLASEVVARWLSTELRARAPQTYAAAQRMLESAPPEGYAACCAAIRDADLSAEVAAIRAPTLVVAGSQDPATPPAEVHLLADAITGAQYVELPASHLSNLEAPEAFTAALTRFLTSDERLS